MLEDEAGARTKLRVLLGRESEIRGLDASSLALRILQKKEYSRELFLKRGAKNETGTTTRHNKERSCEFVGFKGRTLYFTFDSARQLWSKCGAPATLSFTRD
jgi:hypothetical protein